MIGTRVGDYEIVELVGEGGMGMVYKGRHAALGMAVAVKSLHSEYMNDTAARERFVREAEALARLNHPNIIRLLNFLDLPEGCFIIMELAEGEDLETKLERDETVPVDDCLPWFVQVCRGLDYAHQQHMIHRDLKPSNILVDARGHTKLLDFGTAKLLDARQLTQAGMTLGTMVYMSKEQLLGKPLDARSDLYSVGVTLYEVLTGRLPFWHDEEKQLVLQIAKADPVPPSHYAPEIPADLEAVILKCLHKDPNDRYQDARALEQALVEVIEGRGGQVASDVVTGTARISGRVVGPPPAAATLLASPLFVGGLVLLILAVGALVVASMGQGSAARVGGVCAALFGFSGIGLLILAVRSVRGGWAVASVPSGQAVVRVTAGPERGQELALSPNSPVVLGRAPECHLVLTDPGVSGQHVSIIFSGGEFIVRDLGSRNGVFVHHQRSEEARVRSGTEVVLGSTRLVVVG